MNAVETAANAIDTGPFRTILWPVGLDGDPGAAKLVKRLSLNSEATVFLLYLVTNNADSSADEEHAKGVLRSFAREHLCPPDYRILLRHASQSFKARTLIETAEAINADLIVMATTTSGGFTHIFRKDVTQEVLGRAPCPVLVGDPGATHRSMGMHAGNLVPEPGADAKVLRWQR